MDMSNLRPDFHVAQQSRRDKLRIHQHHPNSPHHQHFQNYDLLNYEPSTSRNNYRPGNICYDPAVICPEMLDFPANQESEKRVAGEDPSFGNNFYRETQTIFNPSANDPQYFNTWKSIASSQSTTDWVANQTPIFVDSTLPNVSCGEISVSNCSSANYQNALQELVTSSNANRSFGLELVSLRQKNAEEITSHGNYYDQWSGALDYAAAAKNTDHRNIRIVANDNSDKQALSLSLSSVPSPKVHTTQIADRNSTPTDVDPHYSRDVCTTTGIQESITWNPNSSTVSRNLVNARQGMTGTQALSVRNPGPLGPFTGYATILRNSRFLRPAEQLLDELCCVARPKNVDIHEVSDKILEDVRVSGSNVESNLSGSSFAFDGSSDMGREAGGVSFSTDSYQHGNLQKKAKLMYMQDEVCKRYKQYHQQIQMVVSSFESVAGLSAATPYVGLALKLVSKHFRCVKNAITHQLKIIRNALGEELSSHSGGTSSIKGDASSMLKFFDHSFDQKQKGASTSIGILESQHIWRPQRGLPERAVSILRAWLFDHFLHPYPTDTDKHMLATQTGLTRNQVSNWFINARVRVWKPMVEEIHMLETKGMAEAGGLLTNTGKATNNESRDQANDASQSTNRFRMISSNAIPYKQVECSSEQDGGRLNANVWNQEKRSRIEYHHHIPPGVHGSLVGLAPSHRSGVDQMGGMGSVSLTLGLRQSAENGQRPYFGGQIIRDFVG